jgi:DegV family protein with EDD domain
MNVGIVTDSTCDIPENLIRDLSINVVPIYIHFGKNIYRDGIDISLDEFYKQLITSPTFPTTSQPNPADFVKIYSELLKKFDGIVSIHISSAISGTYNAALSAKREMGNSSEIEVIDSQYNSAGLGLLVLNAARLAKKKFGIHEIARETRERIKDIYMLGMFSTMQYLAKGGRVNKVVANLSGLLNVKPLLTFDDGQVVRAGFVNTVSKGVQRIYDFVGQYERVEEVIIVHSQVPQKALLLKNRLSNKVSSDKILIAQLGAGLGVHGGPGVLLAAVRTR